MIPPLNKRIYQAPINMRASSTPASKLLMGRVNNRRNRGCGENQVSRNGENTNTAIPELAHNVLHNSKNDPPPKCDSPHASMAAAASGHGIAPKASNPANSLSVERSGFFVTNR